MNAASLFKLVPAGALAALLAGCGVTERDPHRFEAMADRIAAIPLTTDEAAAPLKAEPVRDASPDEAERRPLRVELLTPHQLWDARDGLTGKAAQVLPAMVPDFIDPEAPKAEPAARPAPPAHRPASAVLIQLGAFASRDAAQAAWGRLSRDADGLTPVYEPVEVNGRRLVRLKVRAASGQAAALCAAAAASDPWCVRAAEAASSTGKA
ncbi:SPOR domain-containing protein [Brevundimonas faecalis]|uniref:SPOR domain-containing protein n=1 Tax=Brevundimonas faecalis TaxID=947378 RepID=A0ABV2RDG3_9CAUL